MTPESLETVRNIRQRVAEERAILNDLDRNFTEEPMKEWVRRTLFYLDDVETFFLRSMETTVDRTPAREAAWLRAASFPLQMAVLGRTQLQNASVDYGVGVTLIG